MTESEIIEEIERALGFGNFPRLDIPAFRLPRVDELDKDDDGVCESRGKTGSRPHKGEADSTKLSEVHASECLTRPTLEKILLDIFNPPGDGDSVK